MEDASRVRTADGVNATEEKREGTSHNIIIFPAASERSEAVSSERKLKETE